jgi:preprotein translocase subunit SecY
MWLGEQITERGIGNGISLIIFAGIVTDIPGGARSTVLPDEQGLDPAAERAIVAPS